MQRTTWSYSFHMHAMMARISCLTYLSIFTSPLCPMRSGGGFPTHHLRRRIVLFLLSPRGMSCPDTRRSKPPVSVESPAAHARGSVSAEGHRKRKDRAAGARSRGARCVWHEAQNAGVGREPARWCSGCPPSRLQPATHSCSLREFVVDRYAEGKKTAYTPRRVCRCFPSLDSASLSLSCLSSSGMSLARCAFGVIVSCQWQR
jgi:hypothetical protein